MKDYEYAERPAGLCPMQSPYLILPHHLIFPMQLNRWLLIHLQTTLFAATRFAGGYSDHLCCAIAGDIFSSIRRLFFSRGPQFDRSLSFRDIRRMLKEI